MPDRTSMAVLSTLFILGSWVPVWADTISSCQLNPDISQTCDLFEVDKLGEFTETPDAVALLFPVTAGFVVLFRSVDGTWSDIVWFQDDGSGQADIVQLFSDPFANLPFTISDVAAGATYAQESLNDPTIFYVPPFDDVFRVYSETAVDIDSSDVPEPSSLALVFLGLVLTWLASVRPPKWNTRTSGGGIQYHVQAGSQRSR